MMCSRCGEVLVRRCSADWHARGVVAVVGVGQSAFWHEGGVRVAGSACLVTQSGCWSGFIFRLFRGPLKIDTPSWESTCFRFGVFFLVGILSTKETKRKLTLLGACRILL